QTSAIYVNGELKASVDAVGQMEITSYPLYIGADYNSPGGYFTGKIDDVRIYNRALSAAEISALAGVTPVPLAPTANPATSVTSDAFTANWSSASGATGYRLDVSPSVPFTNYVSGYQDLDVGNSTNQNVTG